VSFLPPLLVHRYYSDVFKLPNQVRFLSLIVLIILSLLYQSPFVLVDIFLSCGPQLKASMVKTTLLVPSAPSAPRPKRIQHASSKVIDPANVADAQLRSHKDAIIARQIADAAVATVGPDTTGPTSETPASNNRSSSQTMPTAIPPSEPLMIAKHANPMTETDSISDDDHDVIRHHTLYFV